MIQVFILLSRTLESGGGLEKEVSELRDDCLKWMWRWRAKIMSSRAVAEGLGR